MSYQSKPDLIKDALKLGVEIDSNWTREQIQAAIDEFSAAQPGAVEDDEPKLKHLAGGNLGFPHQPGEAPAG